MHHTVHDANVQSALPNQHHVVRRALLELVAPFECSEIQWRVGRSGLKHGKPWAQVFPYVDARTLRKRLTEVLGAENWRVEFSCGPDNGMISRVSLRLGGEWIAKEDGAGPTPVEGVKGAISGAFKRACSAWGIGEYLYDVPSCWGEFVAEGAHFLKIDGTTFHWNAPQLPARSLPANNASHSTPLRLPTPLRSVVRSDASTSGRSTDVESRGASTSRDAGQADYDAKGHAGVTIAGEVVGVRVPFGQLKGRLLAEVITTHRAEVVSGRNWASTRAQFAAYVAAVDQLVA